jgi:hypothetical protein
VSLRGREAAEAISVLLRGLLAAPAYRAAATRAVASQKRQKFPSEEFLAPSLRSLFFAAGRDSRRLKIRARSRKLGFAPPPALVAA